MPFIFDPISGNLTASNVPGATPYATSASFPAIATSGALAIALNTLTLYAYNTGLSTWVPIATPGDVLSVGTLDSNGASANGASINDASQLIMQSASASDPGLINNTVQTLSGVKTFASAPSALGAASGSEQWGANAIASASNATALGNGATASATGSLAVGEGAIANASNAIAMGSASVAGANDIAIGFNASTTGSSGNSTAVGSYSSASGTDGTAFGYSAYAVGTYSTAFGSTSYANGNLALSFGPSATANGNGAIAIGGGSVATANQLVIGQDNDTYAITDVYIGSGTTRTSAVSDVTYHGTGGSGTNYPGANLNIAAGQSTGNATPAVVNINAAPVGSSGSAPQTLQTIASFSGIGMTLPAFTTAGVVANNSSGLLSTILLGGANGVASLDGSGKVPAAQLPSTVLEYQGLWNPNTNTPVLADLTGTNGYVYQVSTAYSGTIVGLSNSTMTNFQVGNLVIYSSTLGQWQQADALTGVTSVNGAQGAVTVNAINQLTGDGIAGPASGSASAVFTLATVATAGTYPKVTVNAKGLVTSGTTLSSGDIPNNAANTTGTAANITATSNSTIITLSSLSLPATQLTGLVGSSNGGTGVNNGGTLTYGSNNISLTTTGSTSLTLPTSGTVLVANGGDIQASSFSLANNQSSAANITGLAFSSSIHGATIQYSIVISATGNLYEAGELLLCNIGNTGWQIAATSVGNTSNVVFSITSAGQVQYTSANYTGFSSGTIYFRAWAL